MFWNHPTVDFLIGCGAGISGGGGNDAGCRHRVTQSGLELDSISGDLAGLVGSVDHAARIDVIRLAADDVVGKLVTGEPPLDATLKQDPGRIVRLHCKMGVADQIIADHIAGLAIVRLPGQLDIAPALVASTVATPRVAHAICPGRVFALQSIEPVRSSVRPIFLNRLDSRRRLVMGSRQAISQHADVFVRVFGFPFIQQSIEAFDLVHSEPAPVDGSPYRVEENGSFHADDFP